MKKLLPSLREKNRYIVYKVVYKAEKNLSPDDVKRIIHENTERFLGELEMAKADMLIMNKYKENKGIIKVNNKYTNKIRSALILIKDPVIETVYVSGTLKKALSRL